MGLTEGREREGKKGVGKGGIGMKREENWSSGRKVEQEGIEDEARKMKEGREEKTKDGVNGREGGRVRKELVRDQWINGKEEGRVR